MDSRRPTHYGIIGSKHGHAFRTVPACENVGPHEAVLTDVTRTTCEDCQRSEQWRVAWIRWARPENRKPEIVKQ